MNNAGCGATGRASALRILSAAMSGERRKPHESTLAGTEDRGDRGGRGLGRETMVLTVVWSPDEPERVGEVAVIPLAATGMSFSLGRADHSGPDGAIPLVLQRLRPHHAAATGPFESAKVSRWQVQICVDGPDALTVEALGRGVMRVNDHQCARAAVRDGDLVEIVGRFMLRVGTRPALWPRGPAWTGDAGFGVADRFGIVGESPAIWALRHQIAFLASVEAHVLVTGPSGAGKELAVQAIHSLSRRGPNPLLARNAATIPETLIDAELFGNLKNYPNPGTPDRLGLVGEADQSSLFLDEIGELSPTQQARLLRVMDHGEYQRLGEARPRSTDVRLLAATNRDPEALKHDFLARFPHRVEVPGLGEHRDDIPLLLRHQVRSIAAQHPEQVARFMGPDNQPQFSAQLIATLTRYPFTTHARELIEILWRAIAASPGEVIDLPPSIARVPLADPPSTTVDPQTITREQLLAALAECDGVRERAWRVLNLRSRDQLKRLLKKYDLI